MGDAGDLNEIQSRLRRFRDDRDWDQFHRPSSLASAISVEAAELLELFLWSSPSDEEALLETRREQVEEELADVLIQCLNFADAAGVDVLVAIDQKIDRNGKRYPVDSSRGRATKYDRL
jgi:NTP pyrophosphatase (non-canonical NTP hydrolase)